MRVKQYLAIILAITVMAICSTAFVAHAQKPATCAITAKYALNQVGTACANLPLNTSCYGNPTVERTTLSADNTSVVDLNYTKPGDQADLATTDTITTAPFDLENNVWGVNIMNVQANLPDDTDKGIMYIQMGGVQLTNETPADSNDIKPMQEISIKTSGGIPCVDDPPIVLIQAPENTAPRLTVNGLVIEIHSTIVITIGSDGKFKVGVVSGSIIINPGPNQVVVNAGYSIVVALDVNGTVLIDTISDPALDPAIAALAELLASLPTNILNYIPTVPVIACPSGVGDATCVIVQ